MRFLIDAQLSRQLAGHLSEAGFEASHVFDHLDPAAADVEIVALANRLGASVVSKDADFIDLANRHVLERTFVHVRVPNLSNQQLLLRLDRALPDIVSAVRRNARIVELR
jgi:predicted nuclease of predicted toxin-antitoxin system